MRLMSLDTVYAGAEKPYPAAPAATECGEPAAFASGPVHQAGPFQIDIFSAEPWNGEDAFRNQADGFFA